MKTVLTTLTLALALTLGGCQTLDPHTGEAKTSNSTWGSVAGAFGGAVIGALANGSDPLLGAAVGATAGGLAGGSVGHYMDNQEAKLRAELEGTGVRVERVGNHINLIMPGDITFDVDRVAIRPQYVDVLGGVAMILADFKETGIRIEGHTDSSGSDGHNLKLSNGRALNVREVLLRKNININRTQVVGYGETMPIASNDTEQGRAANRRVNLKLVPMVN